MKEKQQSLTFKKEKAINVYRLALTMNQTVDDQDG